MSVIERIDKDVEKIIESTLEDIVSERFARYSKYIIQDRALPDARDGLKPVQRRILYAMQQMGMFHNKPYKKSARIAGEVMGKYHPHGDSSIYEAMVRLIQDFKMRVPLIDMHGNNGSIDGDSAAAMRYTEARLSKAAEALLGDIDKRTVPFVPNFDDEELEPTVLPAKFPNLLVNGATGISAGYATKYLLIT
jgi:topoisomerase IV subunit A